MDLSNMEVASAGKGTKTIRVVAPELMPEVADAELPAQTAAASLVKASLIVAVGFFALFLF